MRIAAIILLLSLNTFAFAQSTVVDTAVLKREYNDVTWQTALNFHYFSAMGHQWYTQAVITAPEYGSLAESYRFRLQTGYELNASEHWRVSFGGKLNLAKYAQYFVPRVGFAHHGKLASLDFIKEFNGELTLNLEKNSNAYGRTALLSCLIGLGKDFKIGNSALYTSLSYKPYIYILTKVAASNIYANRTIDHAQWRLDLLYKFNEHFRAGVYALWDSDHYYTLGGTSSVSGPYPDARVNQITPIFGLNLFYILRGDKREGYLPIWPSK